MSRIIPKRVLEEIRFGNEISDVVGSYMTLSRAGQNFRALCPFHKEKTPSFHIDTQRQNFHCFGCNAGGDVFEFVKQHENVDFIMAVRILAERAGIKVELEEGEEGGSDKAAHYRIHQDVAEFYQRCLLQMGAADRARQYLQSRELGEPLIENFLIGFAPNRWDAMLKWGEKKGVGVEQLEGCGLVIESTRSDSRSTHYDRFRNRIMFPIRDEQGRVIGFSGRALDDKAKTAKYVNSPETLLFRKSRVLYAMDKARRPIVDAGEAIICEGQIDVIRCHAAGFETAVAAQGTAFTADHARILKRYADSVVLIFDPDKAGQDAAIRSATIFMDVGLAVRVARLPDGKDPDTLIREEGADGFRRIIEESQSAVGFQISVLSGREDISREIGIMRVSRAALQTISHNPNAVQRAKLVQEAADQLHLPTTALEDDLRFVLSRPRREIVTQEITTESASSEQPREEVELCEHLVHVVDEPEIADLVDRYLPLDIMKDVDCRKIAEASLTARETGDKIVYILGKDDSETSDNLLRLLEAVQSAPTKIRGTDCTRSDAVRDIILRLWRRRLASERADIQAKLKSGEKSPELAHRNSQLTLDLDSLKSWTDGASIIEMEMAE
jgi:DNA primase